MRVCLLVLALLLAKSQITKAENQQTLEVSNEKADSSSNTTPFKNGPSEVEHYVEINSPNNYPLEAPEDNNTTIPKNSSDTPASENAIQESQNGSSIVSIEDIPADTSSTNTTTSLLNSSSEDSSSYADESSTDLKTSKTLNETLLPLDLEPVANNTFPDLSSKHIPTIDENKTLSDNKLEIIEVTQFVPVNHNEETGISLSDVDETLPENESFSVIASQISDEIKVFSNEAMMAWEDLKEKVEKASEASHVLDDYLDKIRISQSANNTECVKGDLKNYERRKQDLKGVVTVCEQTIKREAWNKLQKKTKEVLSEINDIKQQVSQAEGKLTESNENEKDNNLSQLNDAKELLNSIDTLKVKKDLSAIEKRCLKEDEDELTKCINNKTEKGMIVDTLNDIMRIKNNCVG